VELSSSAWVPMLGLTLVLVLVLVLLLV